MNNQKDLEKELEGLSYLPKTVEPSVTKEDITLPTETTTQTTQLSLKQKIANVLADFKKKGKVISPKLKKWATSALAGSLIAGMLFLSSCASMKSMQQIYPQEVVSMLEENGFSSKDYDTKKQEFLNANPADLDCGLKIVPYQYYRDRFGLTDQEISKRVLGTEVLFIDGSLYLGAKYIVPLKEAGKIKDGEDPNLNRDLLFDVSDCGFAPQIATLFKYDLDPEIYEALKSAYDSTDLITNNKAIDKDKYMGATNFIKVYDKTTIREDKINNFAYRYLLDSIISSYTPKVMGEGAHWNTGANAITFENNWSTQNDTYRMIDRYMICGYPYIEDGYLYAYCIGVYRKDLNDAYLPKDKYLLRVSIKLNELDMKKIDERETLLGIPTHITPIINNAKNQFNHLIDRRNEITVIEIGKCENKKLRESPYHDARSIVLQDFYAHGGRPESLEFEYIFGLK